MPRRTSRTASASAPIPVVSPSWPMPPQETVEHLEVGLHYSCGVMLLFSVSWCMWDFVCALSRVVCLFPLLVWQSYSQIPLPFKVRWLGNSKSLCQNRRLGCLMWGAELSQSWEIFFGIFVLQLPTQRVWDLNSLWLYPSYYVVATSTFSLNVGYHFWCVPASSCW